MLESITDYILYPVELRYVLKDVEVIRGAELSTDYRQLVTDTRFRKGIPEKTKTYQKLFTGKLRRERTQKNYQRNLENKLESVTIDGRYENCNVDDRWTKLKSVIMEVAEQTCGKKCVNTKRKIPRWWSETVREAVKRKKEAWEKYMKTRSPLDLENYRTARNEARRTVKEAKENWIEFGQETKSIYQSNNHRFWRALKVLEGNMVNK
jgi:hypothetical protein